jgi:hypothetical protein
MFGGLLRRRYGHFGKLSALARGKLRSGARVKVVVDGEMVDATVVDAVDRDGKHVLRVRLNEGDGAEQQEAQSAPGPDLQLGPIVEVPASACMACGTPR